ncbi:hypothetical protein AC068_04425 [Morganella morganii]|nr:hypothetical protein AC068_04425 [Morganella morganii]
MVGSQTDSGIFRWITVNQKKETFTGTDNFLHILINILKTDNISIGDFISMIVSLRLYTYN